MSGAIELPDDEGETVSMELGESLSFCGPMQFPCDFGGYRLIRLLGRGGMGTVYEAEQLTTGRLVALKMLGHKLDSPDMRKRFLREGRLAAGISHPNSLYVFGSEEIEGLPVITMEVAGRGTLKDRLNEDGPLATNEAVDAVLDVVSGLEVAFAHGVLHRDIKPSNCFICPDGSVKVGDFGLSVSTLARSDTFVTGHGKIMGTPAYASPEQLRGDTLDVRADIYSIGATLFTLLTDRAPFEGDNAVQVVANAVNKKAMPLRELREDVPAGLERVVARCLAKEPGKRYADYASLRGALLPFSSREPEPASIKIRESAGWIDYLIAFLPVYVVLMLFVGVGELIIRPHVERTLYSLRYYIVLFAIGFLYFGISEGIWGAGLGKYLKGLRVVRTNGRPPGFVRALIRIVIPVGCVEGVRMPLMMALISGADWSRFQVLLFISSTIVCPWLAVLLTLSARRENGFATVWDLVSGTRVVVKPKGAARPLVKTEARRGISAKDARSIGPYRIIEETVPGEWIIAADPVLRRRIWLLRRRNRAFSLARRNVARPGRLRWQQKVETSKATWDAFEAPEGVPFCSLVEGGRSVQWSSLRHWLGDLASELWYATDDETLPDELGPAHVWVSGQGHAVVLDEPWPEVKEPSECISVRDLAGQQRFLDSIAACVDSTSLPLHARGVLQNLKDGKFEKLSFLAGTLRGLLDKPAEVSKGIRAGSVFMLGLYTWIAAFVGYYQAEKVQQWRGSVGGLVIISAIVVLGVIALIQLLELVLFRTTASHAIFRLAVVNAKGQLADRVTLLRRWAVVWLALLVPMLPAAVLIGRGVRNSVFVLTFVALVLWLGAAVYTVVCPNRGLHDRLADTWVVRR
jgi:hypothetical protein